MPQLLRHPRRTSIQSAACSSPYSRPSQGLIGCGSVGISCTDKNIEDEIKSLVEDEVGYPDDFFVGYTDKTNLVIVTEMNYPDGMIENFENIIRHKREEKTKTREGSLKIRSSFANEQTIQEPFYKVEKEKQKGKQENTAKKLSKWF